MAQQTICPACGAPLTYTGTADEIRCPFCDTELQVLHENGQEHFRILSQPGPQKEVLSRPVEGGQPQPAQPPSAEVSSETRTPSAERTQPPATPANATPTAEMPAVLPGAEEDDINTRATVLTQRPDFQAETPRQQPPQPQPGQTPEREKQTAPGYPGFISDEADRRAFSPERLHSEHTVESATVPEATPYYQMHQSSDVPVTGAAQAPGSAQAFDAPTAPRRRNWGPLVLALIIGLIIFLACAAGAWMMLARIVRAS